VRVIEAPNAMAASGLQPVNILQPPAQAQVPHKDGAHNVPLFDWLRAEKA